MLESNELVVCRLLGGQPDMGSCARPAMQCRDYFTLCYRLIHLISCIVTHYYTTGQISGCTDPAQRSVLSRVFCHVDLPNQSWRWISRRTDDSLTNQHKHHHQPVLVITCLSFNYPMAHTKYPGRQ